MLDIYPPRATESTSGDLASPDRCPARPIGRQVRLPRPAVAGPGGKRRFGRSWLRVGAKHGHSVTLKRPEGSGAPPKRERLGSRA